MLPRLGLFKKTGFLRSHLWVQRKISLPQRENFSGWARCQMSLHRGFLRIGPVVGDAVRDLSIDVLDFSDLWLRWEHGDFYTVGINSFVTQHGSGSVASDLGQDDFDLGRYTQLAEHRVVDQYHLLVTREDELFCN